MSNYIQKEKEQAIADLDKTIAVLSASRDLLVADLNKGIPLIKQLLNMGAKARGTWVIKTNEANGIYYQFNGIGIGINFGIGLIRNGESHRVTQTQFAAQFRLATPNEVKQHLEYLASKTPQLRVMIKGETPATSFDPMKCEFYMVTCRGLRGAKVRHTTYAEAEQIAKDLAKQENHKTWIVGVVASVEPVTKMIPQVTYQVKKK